MRSTRVRMLWVGMACLVASAVAGPAAAYLIKPDGTGDVPTIQDAIDLATPGHIIELADGVFTGPGNRGIDFKGKTLTLQSRSGNAEACIIDGQGSESDPTRVLIFDSNEGPLTRVNNITITGGYLPWSADWQDTIGAGVYIKNAGPTLRGCIMRDNYGLTGAGATIYFDNGATLIDCVIESNHTGVYAHVAWFGEVASLIGCRIASNATYGVHNQNSTLAMWDCVIEGNGTFGLLAWQDGFTTLERVLITGNLGGGVVMGERTLVTLTECQVIGNRGIPLLTGDIDLGGGVSCLDSATLTVENSVIAGNIASDEDGVPNVGGGIYCHEASVVVRGSTIAGNEGGEGGGIYAVNGTVELEQTIVWGNCADDDTAIVGEGAVTSIGATCSALDPDRMIVRGGAQADMGSDMIAEDPRFCGPYACADVTDPTGTLTLAEDSPCLPENSGCGLLVGAFGEGCAATPVRETTWGAIKDLMRN